MIPACSSATGINPLSIFIYKDTMFLLGGFKRRWGIREIAERAQAEVVKI